MKRFNRRDLILSAAATALAASGCGTILHPERRGQPAGPLDWKIVALDAIGLLLFFIPGVIAFAVDFTTGAIYLPPPGYGYSGLESGRSANLTRVQLPKDELHEEGIARAVSRRLGRDIELQEGSYQTEPLESIDEFWSVSGRLVAQARSQQASGVMRAQSK